MTEEQFAEFASAANQMAMIHTGQLAALQTVVDALVATVVTSLPPLTEKMQETLKALAAVQREAHNLQPIEAQFFDSLIEATQANLDILRR
ncbi:hypothetical protein [Variovorax sp. dw_308]|uniref:hypothetical protein n=1 Tax=Variovorax sp. dw_308 TaxID=2721546 RepID=UPI001C43C53C|nr:hypothetical protein [Variovorax sp. dw_308]